MLGDIDEPVGAGIIRAFGQDDHLLKSALQDCSVDDVVGKRLGASRASAPARLGETVEVRLSLKLAAFPIHKTRNGVDRARSILGAFVRAFRAAGEREIPQGGGVMVFAVFPGRGFDQKPIGRVPKRQVPGPPKSVWPPTIA